MHPFPLFKAIGDWYQKRGEHVLNMCGFGLLGICFLIATLRIALTSEAATDPDVVTIRLAHWGLEGGVREGLDEVGREYEKICAARGQKVRFEQLPVPEQVYPNWFITQLIGGTAPDLMAIGMGSSDERLARFFQPFSPYLDAPNPYNKGTKLEGVPWRDTFIDGLQGAYKPELLDYYSLPFTMLTTRVFYNKDMYREMFGDRPTPVTFEEFTALCRDFIAKAKESGRTGVAPISGSRYNGPMIMGRLLGCQTQKLTRKVNRSLTLDDMPEENMLAYLRGEWNIDSDDIVSGFELMQTVIQYMQPGFIQLQREDAMLHFVQRRSLMIASGAWDRTSIETESPFAVGVFRIPVPSPQSPKYGKYMYGQLAEVSGGGAGGFGLNRNSPHIETAVDFYRFLTSQRGSELFSKNSGWLPTIIGAKVSPSIDPFRPESIGYPAGTTIVNGAESKRLWDRNFYLLTKTPESSAPFRSATGPELKEAFLADLQLTARGRVRSVTRLDTPVAALWWQSRTAPDSAPKFGELIETQDAQESAMYRYRKEVADVAGAER